MNETSRYYTGDRVMYRGEMAEVVTVGIYDRETDSEHYGYTIELGSGETVARVREADLQPYQQKLL